MQSTYPSAIDWWIAAVIISAPVMVIVSGIVTLFHVLILGIGEIVLGVVIGGAIALLIWPCRYVLQEQELLIQTGVLKETIPYNQIKDVERSSSPLSAPALSLKRVKISMVNGDFRLVSPQDRDQFIAELQRYIAPT